MHPTLETAVYNVTIHLESETCARAVWPQAARSPRRAACAALSRSAAAVAVNATLTAPSLSRLLDSRAVAAHPIKPVCGGRGDMHDLMISPTGDGVDMGR